MPDLTQPRTTARCRQETPVPAEWVLFPRRRSVVRCRFVLGLRPVRLGCWACAFLWHCVVAASRGRMRYSSCQLRQEYFVARPTRGPKASVGCLRGWWLWIVAGVVIYGLL